MATKGELDAIGDLLREVQRSAVDPVTARRHDLLRIANRSGKIAIIRETSPQRGATDEEIDAGWSAFEAGLRDAGLLEDFDDVVSSMADPS